MSCSANSSYKYIVHSDDPAAGVLTTENATRAYRTSLGWMGFRIPRRSLVLTLPRHDAPQELILKGPLKLSCANLSHVENAVIRPAAASIRVQ